METNKYNIGETVEFEKRGIKTTGQIYKIQVQTKRRYYPKNLGSTHSTVELNQESAIGYMITNGGGVYIETQLTKIR